MSSRVSQSVTKWAVSAAGPTPPMPSAMSSTPAACSGAASCSRPTSRSRTGVPPCTTATWPRPSSTGSRAAEPLSGRSLHQRLRAGPRAGKGSGAQVRAGDRARPASAAARLHGTESARGAQALPPARLKCPVADLDRSHDRAKCRRTVRHLRTSILKLGSVSTASITSLYALTRSSTASRLPSAANPPSS